MKLVLFVWYVVCILQYLTLMCIYLLQLLSIRESIPPLSCFLSSCSCCLCRYPSQCITIRCRCLRPQGQVLIPFLKSKDFFSPQLTTSHLIFSVQSFEDCGFYMKTRGFMATTCEDFHVRLAEFSSIFFHCCSPCFHLVSQSFPLFSQVKRLYFVGVNVDPSDGSLGSPSAGRPTAFWGWPRICPCDFVSSLTFVSNMCVYIYYYVLYVHINKYMLHTYAMEREKEWERDIARESYIYAYIYVYIYVYIYILYIYVCRCV